jgi:radical SAM superfamily enzyme YgiQ (UPF0313 family)
MKAMLAIPPFPASTLTTYGEIMACLGKKAAEPNLGIITVAALLPGDWDLSVFDLSFRKISEHEWQENDLLFLTGLTIQEREIVSLIEEGKHRGKTVIVGGPWAFHAAEKALDAGADFVVVGEAESCMESVLTSLASGKERQIIVAERRPDLEKSPPPRWDLLTMDAYISMPIQFCRGCPFQCEFCDVTFMLGREVRTKSPEQVIGELEILYGLGWRGHVAFVDDNLIGRPVRTKELLRQLAPWMAAHHYPFRFETQVSINLTRDDELLDLMARSGFSKVCVGIESLEQDSLKQTGKFQNLAVDAREACRKVSATGIKTKATFIIGFDGETPGVDRRVMDFTIGAGMPDALLQPLVAYPGTELWNRLERDGRLLPDSDTNLGTPARLPNFVTVRPIDEIAGELVHFFQVVYECEFCLERAFEQISILGNPPGCNMFKADPLLFMRIAVLVLYRQGLKHPTRWKFWKLLFAVLLRHPSKLYDFLSYLAFAQHHFEFRETVQAEVQAALEEWRGERFYNRSEETKQPSGNSRG